MEVFIHIKGIDLLRDLININRLNDVGIRLYEKNTISNGTGLSMRIFWIF